MFKYSRISVLFFRFTFNVPEYLYIPGINVSTHRCTVYSMWGSITNASFMHSVVHIVFAVCSPNPPIIWYADVVWLRVCHGRAHRQHMSADLPFTHTYTLTHAAHTHPHMSACMEWDNGALQLHHMKCVCVCECVTTASGEAKIYLYYVEHHILDYMGKSVVILFQWTAICCMDASRVEHIVDLYHIWLINNKYKPRIRNGLDMIQHTLELYHIWNYIIFGGDGDSETG